jgi:hypothetical protein
VDVSYQEFHSEGEEVWFGLERERERERVALGFEVLRFLLLDKYHSPPHTYINIERFHHIHVHNKH